MKKIAGVLLIACMALITVSAHAQIRFGVKGGVNISKVHFNEDLIKGSNVTGFHIGPMVEVMTPYTGLGMDVAILYSQKGMEYNGPVKSESFNADYLDIPLNLKWKFGLPIVKGYINAGPYFAFRIAGDKVWEVPSTVRTDVKAKNFNTGLNIGAGVEVIKHLQVGFNYGFDLTGSFEAEFGNGGEGRNRTWSLVAAILF